MKTRRLVPAIALLFLAGPAFSQSTVLQSGTWQPGHAPMYSNPGSSQPIVQDSGPAGGGGAGLGLNEQLLIERAPGVPPFVNAGTGPLGTNWCDYDAPITNSTGYHYLCFGPNAQGGGLINYGAGAGAPALPLTINVNGLSYSVPTGVTTVPAFALLGNNTASSAAVVGLPLSTTQLAWGALQTFNGGLDSSTANVAGRTTTSTANVTTNGGVTIGAPGLVGDGATDNTATLMADITSALASTVGKGAYVKFPCGVFAITGVHITVPSGKHLTIDGSGQGCTTLLHTGTDANFAALGFDFADGSSSASVRNMSIRTTHAGLVNAILFNQTTDITGQPIYQDATDVENVSIYGSDWTGTNPSWTNYFASGITQFNVSDVTYDNVFIVGGGCIASVCDGFGIYIDGYNVSNIAVISNINASTIQYVQNAIYDGSNFQGLSIVNLNVVGAQTGVLCGTASLSIPSQLAITGGALDYNVFGVDCRSGGAFFSNLSITGVAFFPEGGFTPTGVILSAINNWTLTGNTFNGTEAAALELAGNTTGGVFSSNAIQGSAVGVKVDALVNSGGVNLIGNKFTSVTNRYVLDATSVGVAISDTNPVAFAGLPGCGAQSAGSLMAVNNNNTSVSYNGAISAGGTGVTPVWCDGGGSWKQH